MWGERMRRPGIGRPGKQEREANRGTVAVDPPTPYHCYFRVSPCAIVPKSEGYYSPDRKNRVVIPSMYSNSLFNILSTVNNKLCLFDKSSTVTNFHKNCFINYLSQKHNGKSQG